MEPFYIDNFSVFLGFYDDDDSKQVYKVVQIWLKANHVEVLNWSAQNPDTNSIENLLNDKQVKIRPP